MESNNVIPKITATTPYATFFCQHLLANRPCLFEADLTKDWRCRREWIDQNGQLSLDHLTKYFGNSIVNVLDQTESGNDETYDAPPKNCGIMAFSDFINLIQGMNYFKDTNGEPAAASNIDNHFASLPTSKASQIFYVKDWHFPQEYAAYNAYSNPIYFQSDWLNEYFDIKADSVQSDYRFLYMGTKGSWTPLHADVFRSYSWSANIYGRKLWYLLPAGKETQLPEGTSDLRKVSPELLDEIGTLQIIQQPGEVIFVPSGWYHQVHNLDPIVVSINHNWVNATNIDAMSAYLSSQLAKIETEIDDCKPLLTQAEWEAQCNLILRTDTGMDFDEFRQFLELILKRRNEFEATKVNSKLRKCPSCDKDLAKLSATNDCRLKFENAILESCQKPNDDKPSTMLCTNCKTFFGRYDRYVLMEILGLLEK